MLNESRFHAALESAQWKISHSGSISAEKMNVYWREFKDVELTDNEFASCLEAVSRRSNFFPKVAEIWEEVNKTRSILINKHSVPIELIPGIPKPLWFDEVFERGKEEQKCIQDRLNAGKYLGSNSF